MEFDTLKKIISSRRSMRKFKPEQIDENELIEILKIATWAPSAGNTQSWDLILIKDQDKKRALARAALSQSFIKKSSHVVVVCANFSRSGRVYGKRGINMYVYQDTAALVQNLLLLIHAKGWGAVWVGAFKGREVAEILEINIEKDNVKPVAIIPIGYPVRDPNPPKRIPLNEILHLESFGKLYK